MTLRVGVPGKGRVTATAKGAKVTKRVKRAGAVTLKLKSRGEVREGGVQAGFRRGADAHREGASLIVP